MPLSQFLEHTSRGAPDYVVLTPAYPNLMSNGGEFIRTRVQAYAASGLVGHVVVFSGPAGSPPETRETRDGPVTVIGPDVVDAVLGRVRREGTPLLVHSPTPAVSRLLHEKLPGKQFALWYHGYEVRDYRRLICNYDTRALALSKAALDRLNTQRFAAAAPLFADASVAKVFVSDFQRRYSGWDVGVEARNAHVIPNHIDTETYQPRVRRPEEAPEILLMRSFANRNYANDVALKAIQILSDSGRINGLRFTVRGFGPLFEKEIVRVRGIPQVTIQPRYSGPAEMAMAHYDHGVFLCPSRFDTQGVMLGEAMASGMVTITNPVAGIPEYTDETCSLLPRPDDPWAFADAMWHLVTHPEVMPAMSRRAAERVARQCGVEATINRELEIIRGLTA